MDLNITYKMINLEENVGEICVAMGSLKNFQKSKA